MALTAPAAAVISAGMQSGMSVSGNIMSYRSNRLNREFQERMMNSAHQREASDLRAAGVNPILTADGGSGAQTPTTQPWTPDLSGVGNAGGEFVNKMIELKRLKNENIATHNAATNAAKQGEVLDSQISANTANAAASEASALKTLAEIPGVAASIERTRAETGLARNNALTAKETADKIRAERDAVTLDNVQREKDKQIYDTPVLGTAVRIMEKIAAPVNSATSAASSMNSIRNSNRTLHESQYFDRDKQGRVTGTHKTRKVGK